MLVWHAIVRDESRIIERCVHSLLPHVDGAIVVDTGSTDNTLDLIKRAFDLVNKPLDLHHIVFNDFAQARNEGLAFARASAIPWHYLILADADMELVVEKPDWRNGAVPEAAYDMLQIAGSVAYWNRRLIGRQAFGIYMGVTHEYLDIPTSGQVHGAHFIDHADGANRPGKFERDIAMLKAAFNMETNPGLVQRYNYYLGRSYFDSGNWLQSAQHFKKRVELGGWDEEVWNAQYYYAHCLGNMGDESGFLWEMLKAYEMRPQRAESLYDLAKSFREKDGGAYRSLLFSEPGMKVKRPNDSLFVNEFVYQMGLKEEFAICAYYDKERRAYGAETADSISLSLGASEHSRAQASSNLYWYMQSLKEHVPSFTAEPIKFTPPDGYVAMNPSVVMDYMAGRDLLTLVRAVNYRITPEGRYVSRTGEQVNGQDVIRTRNWLIGSKFAAEIELPLPMQQLDAPFPLVRGFEDSRLFFWRHNLWTLSTVREMTHEGWCEQVLAKLDDDGEKLSISRMHRIAPAGDKRHEKNWMPFNDTDEMQFVYRLGKIVDQSGSIVAEHDTKFAIDHISGGSQVIEVEPGLWMALVHEAGQIPGSPLRYYRHRFVIMRQDGFVSQLSPPFFFNDRQIEFAAGLAKINDDELVISYGIRDEEAWLGRCRIADVLRFCG